MGSSALVLVFVMVVAAGAAAVSGRPGDGTPAARFWEEALEGTPMPEAIANLVQMGVDHSPVVERHPYAYRPDGQPLYKAGCALLGGAGPEAEGLYFHEAQMRVGTTMTVFLPPTESAAFLPRDVADRVPFGNLTDTLAMFKVMPGSKEADQLSCTLSGCREPALHGEHKACATSLEGVVRSAMRMLATRRVSATASALLTDSLPRRVYTVQAASALSAPGSHFVACHARPYPYAVYMCHMTAQTSKSKGYVVSIRGDLPGDSAVAMAALCHFDTSKWSSDHIAFKVLHTQPGGLPVCHFLPYANLLFTQKHANA